MEIFSNVAAELIKAEDSLNTVFSAEIGYREEATQKLVLLHFDGEKFVKSSAQDRLKFLGVKDTSSTPAICMDLGIYLYPIKGHCHEEQFVAEHGESCLAQYFIAYNLDSVLASVLEKAIDQVNAAPLLFDTADQGYTSIYEELLRKEFI